MDLISREDEAGQYRTYHYDRRGSTMALTDKNAQVTDTYTYGHYGEALGHQGETEQPFRYNGRDGVMTDANGLYYMRARYYNPEIKRFVNRDVVAGAIDDAQTLNRYAYVNGNPISYVDPFGLERIKSTYVAYHPVIFKPQVTPSSVFSELWRTGGEEGYRRLKEKEYYPTKDDLLLPLQLIGPRGGGAKGSIKGTGNLLTKYPNFNTLGKNSKPQDLIKSLERQGWTKEIQPGGKKSGPATIFTDPKTGTKIRIHATPGEGTPYFRVQNKGGNYLDQTGGFPSNATKKELRDLTHFYFGK